jgi:hypothetical protein
VSGFVYATIDCFWSHTEHVNFSIVDQPESGRARSFALLWGPLRLEYKVDAAETGLTRKKERASIKVTPSANPITIPTMFARPLALANGGTCADASRIRRENDSKVEMGQRAARRPARWFRGAANVCRLQLQGGAGSACCGALERTLAVNKRVYSRDISEECVWKFTGWGGTSSIEIAASMIPPAKCCSACATIFGGGEEDKMVATEPSNMTTAGIAANSALARATCEEMKGSM